MNDKARRPWFQIHLSTTIVLMFVAGGLLWVNIAPHEQTYVAGLVPDEGNEWSSRHEEFGTVTERGWPLRILQFKILFFPHSGERESPHESLGFPGRINYVPPSSHISVGAIIIKSLVALAFITAAAFACELSIRRREVRT